ncbi:MAG: peptidyl-prolyl cis-trans isomerase [Candidatus Omnitrophica bacterium]|nr:peptidyl-prolyl cis-trans isomerase [Candidatus Omnitrophota bacterium]
MRKVQVSPKFLVFPAHYLHRAGSRLASLSYWREGLIFTLCLLLIFALPCFADDKIVAIVNNDVITRKDLDDFINFTRIQLSRKYTGSELEEKIQSIKVDLLDKLIEDRLLLQEAKKDKATIDENMVRARINEIKKRYNSDAQFQADLSKQGLVQADIENRIKEQLLIYNIIERQIREKVLIKPDEVTDLYDKNIKGFASGEGRELEVITLENEDLAKSFSYNLRTGQKLADLATRYSLEINKLKVSNKEELRKDIEEVVFKLGIGEVSDPVKIEDKYYVFKLDSIIPSKQQSLSEAQDTIHNILFEKKMQDALIKWIDELRKKSYIKIMEQ